MEECIHADENGKLSFGDYSKNEKTKRDGFINNNSTYKVKTFFEITRLEKNGVFAYESVPGTNVSCYDDREKELSFRVKGYEKTHVTLGLKPNTGYLVMIDSEKPVLMDSGIGGKLGIELFLSKGKEISVSVKEQ